MLDPRTPEGPQSHPSTFPTLGEGASFVTENELVERYLSMARQNSPSESKVIIQELESLNGIADIVIAKLRKDWPHSSPMASIPARWAYSFVQLPKRRPFRVEELAAISGTSLSSSAKMVALFNKQGLCEKGTLPGTWRKVLNPRPPAASITAIEAKLSDWKRALFQARRYKSFAVRSWVLLDARKASSAIGNIDHFIERNVGLATICINGRLKTYYRPSRQPPSDPISLWHANTIIAKFVETNRHSK